MKSSVDPADRYDFPASIRVIPYDGKVLVVHPESANWLVLEASEYPIFQYLEQGHTIAEALAAFDEEPVIRVLTEIEAKGFCHAPKEEEVCLSPHELFISLTNECNLRCSHCYMYSGDIRTEELPLLEWKRILTDFSHHGFDTVTFSGGEPLLSPAFVELCEFCHALGYAISVLSNGLLWTRNLVERLDGVIAEVQLSIDGYDEDSYRRVRNSDGFERVLKTIALLEASTIITSVAITPGYQELETEKEHYVAFVKDLQAQYPNLNVSFSFELIPGRNITVTPKLNESYRRSVNAIVTALEPDYLFENFYRNLAERQQVRNCGYGGITLASNGDLYWCNRIFEEEAQGNALSMGVAHIIALSKEVTVHTDVDAVKPCRDCAIRYICGGGCRLHHTPIAVPEDGMAFEAPCTEETREHFYRRMIGANEYFYRS